MELTVMDRLLLLNILPTEGDITTIRIVTQLRGDLSFSEQEHEDFKILNEEGQIKWDKTTELPKEVEIGTKANKIIVKALKKINDDGKLTAQFIALYDKFIPED
jgi:hypothetical protein